MYIIHIIARESNKEIESFFFPLDGILIGNETGKLGIHLHIDDP